MPKLTIEDGFTRTHVHVEYGENVLLHDLLHKEFFSVYYAKKPDGFFISTDGKFVGSKTVYKIVEDCVFNFKKADF